MAEFGSPQEIVCVPIHPVLNNQDITEENCGSIKADEILRLVIALVQNFLLLDSLLVQCVGYLDSQHVSFLQSVSGLVAAFHFIYSSLDFSFQHKKASFCSIFLKNQIYHTGSHRNGFYVGTFSTNHLLSMFERSSSHGNRSHCVSQRSHCFSDLSMELLTVIGQFI